VISNLYFNLCSPPFHIYAFDALRSYTIKPSRTGSSTSIGVVLYSRSYYVNKVPESIAVDWPNMAVPNGMNATWCLLIATGCINSYVYSSRAVPTSILKIINRPSWPNSEYMFFFIRKSTGGLSFLLFNSFEMYFIRSTSLGGAQFLGQRIRRLRPLYKL